MIGETIYFKTRYSYSINHSQNLTIVAVHISKCLRKGFVYFEQTISYSDSFHTVFTQMYGFYPLEENLVRIHS